MNGSCSTIPAILKLKNGWIIRLMKKLSIPCIPILKIFKKAYDEDGLKIDDFDLYGATARTLRGFITSYHDLQAVIRDFMVPNPDN